MDAIRLAARIPHDAIPLLAMAACLAVCMSVVEPALAEDPMTIGAIAANPESYHLRQVTLQGTVRQVHQVEPYQLPMGLLGSPGVACYGAYIFTLEDDTSTLEVVVLGICGTPSIRAPDVSIGDRVIVRAKVQAPGHVGTSAPVYGLDGRPIYGLNPETLHAIASDIRHTGQ